MEARDGVGGWHEKDIDAAEAMAQIAFEGMGWDDARQYAEQVLKERPDDVKMLAIRVALAYRDALAAKNPDEMERSASEAGRLLAGDASLINARRVLIGEAEKASAAEMKRGAVAPRFGIRNRSAFP